MKTSASISTLGVKSGLLTTLALITFFMLMKTLHLHRILELHFLNGFFLFAGILLSMNYLKSLTHGNIDYFQGLLLGILISVISAVSFAVFFYFYLYKIDPGFMQYIKENGWMGSFLNPSLVASTIIIEGISSGAIISYVLMPYFKRNEIEPV